MSIFSPARCLTTLTFLFILAGFAPVLADDIPGPGTDNIDLNPSELHRILGQQKAEALARSRHYQSLAESQGAENQTDYDMLWYDITIRVNDTTEILYGTVSFQAAATVDGLTQIEVDFFSNMVVDDIISDAGSLVFTRSGDVVTITLDGTYNTGEIFEFDFQYYGHPFEGGLQAFTFGLHSGKPSISSLSEPYFARTWWPCKDRMDDKSDSMGIHIEVDTSLYCASNGSLDSITTVPLSNSRTFHYTERFPIATYLFSVAIAPFIVWEQDYVYSGGTMPVIHHVYSDWYNYSLSTWGLTPQILTSFAPVFGEYPFITEKYGHANFDWGGGMEHQTVTSMVGSTFGFATMTVAHELGHQWWGDMVTCKSWYDIWLNEGWASYAEAVYRLDTYGWANYHAYMQLMAYKGSGTVWCSDTTNVWRIFDSNLSYDKGAWVVHMLRGVVGEAGFAAGIAAYRDAFEYSAATTADFHNVWETATGIDLDAFFAQWIYGQYYPVYNYFSFNEPVDGGGYDIYLLVKQTHSTYPQVFDMPVDFFMDYEGQPDDTLTLQVDARREVFKISQPVPVNTIALDPSNWILKTANAITNGLFILSDPNDLSDGEEKVYYEDTILIRGSVAVEDVLIISGQLPPGLAIDVNGIISGVPTQAGQYVFDVGAVNYTAVLADNLTFGMEILPGSCCTGKVGDANLSGGDIPTIGDVSAMIDMLYISGAEVTCMPEADVNQSGGPNPVLDDITIGDISLLIDHLFIDETPIPDCL